MFPGNAQQKSATKSTEETTDLRDRVSLNIGRSEDSTRVSANLDNFRPQLGNTARLVDSVLRECLGEDVPPTFHFRRFSCCSSFPVFERVMRKRPEFNNKRDSLPQIRTLFSRGRLQEVDRTMSEQCWSICLQQQTEIANVSAPKLSFRASNTGISTVGDGPNTVSESTASI